MIHELDTMKDVELRNVCKEKIETLEHWLRRLIHDEFTGSYGADYFSYQNSNGDALIKNSLVRQVKHRRSSEPTRYPRDIDAILLDDAIYLICKKELYTQHFKKSLEDAFPDGFAEARTFLKRLNIPRNNLAHANAISIRQAEQIICYSHDVIESLKKYYQRIGMQNTYNVPTIIKLTDSFGRVFHRENFMDASRSNSACILSLIDQSDAFLRPGDILTLEVEVDASFSTDQFVITWSGGGIANQTGEKVAIHIENKHVSENFQINCTITSNKDWHRFNTHDDRLIVMFKVLPPIN